MGDFKNQHRFDNISDVYDLSRPKTPAFPVEICQKYLGHRPNLVVDMGCGTGLSTLSWCDYSDNIIGIDPNDDMLSVAEKYTSGNVHFIKAFSDNTGLEDLCADVVFCSQSFHWMEPFSTLQEVGRILAPNGIFMVMDYDWPPISNWEAEKSFQELYDLAKAIEKEYSSGENVNRWDKARHMENVKNSGIFRYVREVFFHNTENATAERLYNMALSQSRVEFALAHSPDEFGKKLKEYKATLQRIFADSEFPITFCYRMVIAVK
jgi:ubiquinone/menaquinone biosynthesis C-methylase UbiE